MDRYATAGVPDVTGASGGISPSIATPTADGFEAAAYWQIIRRYLVQILGLALVIGLLTGLVAQSLEPVYQSSTTLLIDTSRRGFSPVKDSPEGGWYSYLSGQTYLQTQLLLLQSQALAESVADRLGLWTHPEFDPRQQAPRRASFQLNLSGLLPHWLRVGDSVEVIADADARRTVVQALTTGLKAVVVPDSDMVRISFDARDPDLAARVAAAYADAYIELGLETRLETVKKAANWLTGRLEGMRTQVETSERKLQTYREKQGLVDVKGDLDLTDRELSDLAQRLLEARGRKEGLGNEYEQVRKLRDIDSAELSSNTVVIRNPIIQTLKTEVVRAERTVSELAERYGAQHPKMTAARSDLNTIRGKLRAEIDNTIVGVKKEFDIAKSRADQLQQEFDRMKARAQDVSRKEFTLRSLDREVETNRQLYDMFLTRFKETDLGSDVESTNARVIDAAQVPNLPIKPRKVRIVAIAVFMALVIGVGLAFFEDRLDNTLKGADDVEHHTQLVTLGTVPLIGRKQRAKTSPERIFLDSPKSDFAEAIRTIRTAVVLSGLDDPHRVVLVTSSVPGEGKTTVAINLAVALSQMERVLLVDADLRRSSVGLRLGLAATAPGLSNLVAGTAAIDECIHQLEGTNLHCLPAGLMPPNPLELLSSQRFRQTLEDLEQRYDRIVLDSAPAQAVSDALVLSRLCNAVIFVIRADATPRQLAQLAIKRLRRVEAPLIGAVLNHFDNDKGSRYGANWNRRYAYAYRGYTQYYGDSDSTHG
ncbi:MAG TPA: polysaccharide biosynthesis tyrosine autokinase [Lamprocystis sp. (in: g-proteobacteria)]|nr:polysaccharide biosynthesis tyrosine autokinase [Lamprocystis sp. (in: g-proteobacteria)]